MKLTDEQLFSLTEENKSGATLECWSDETGENKREYHVFCDADLKKFARAVIAAEDVLRLKDVIPVEKLHILYEFCQWEYYKTNTKPEFYSADTVSALKGRIAELEEDNRLLREQNDAQDLRLAELEAMKDPLKRAIHELLDSAAKEFEHFGGFKDGYSCASRLRKLKEQLI